MATSSITKDFVVKDDQALDKLIKALRTPVQQKKRPSSKKYEEGKKLLAQFYSR